MEELVYNSFNHFVDKMEKMKSKDVNPKLDLLPLSYNILIAMYFNLK